MTCRFVKIQDLVIDFSYQGREQLDSGTLTEYRGLLRDSSDSWPFEDPCVVFDVNGILFLADGFHRCESMKQAEKEAVMADVITGTRRDLLEHVLKANASHGLPRSRADKRRVVQLALQEPDICTLSNPQIAELCCVSPSLVGNERRKIRGAQDPVHSSDDDSKAAKVETSNGRAYPASEEDKAFQRNQIRDAIRENPGQTNTQIAEDVGCDRKTVAKVRHDMELGITQDEPGDPLPEANEEDPVEDRSSDDNRSDSGDSVTGDDSPSPVKPYDNWEDIELGEADEDGGSVSAESSEPFDLMEAMQQVRQVLFSEFEKWPGEFSSDFVEYVALLTKEMQSE